MTQSRGRQADRGDGARPRRRCARATPATLILLDRKGGEFHVLMGRRHMRHAFMPGKFVFPGGRTDPADSRIAVAAGLHPHEEAKLTAGAGRTSLARARAIALSAIRETYEEAGLLIGEKGAVRHRQGRLAGLCRPRRAPFAGRPALDRPRHHAARPRAPLRHALPRRLARATSP